LGKLIRTDLHIHTNLSDCGSPAATFEAVVAAGLEAKLEAIGISDHIFFPQHRERPRLARNALPRETNGMRVYVGCEADMQSPTRCAIDAEFAATLDYVMIAASHLFDPGVEREFIEQPRSMAAYMIGMMRGAIETGFADIIVHPLHVPACDYHFGDFVAAVDETAMRDVARLAAESGVAFECNPSFVRKYPDASKRLFTLLLEEGCTLALNSDAHSPAGIGCRGPGYATEGALRALGITEERVFRIEERVA
jgi:histidinol phosphatase-like PHP family hydrolase